MTRANRRVSGGRRWIVLTIVMVALSLCALFVALMTRFEPADLGEVSRSTEEKWGRFLVEVFAPVRREPTAPCVTALQSLADALTEESRLRPVHVFVAVDERVNAISLPGRRIVVFEGLLEEIESENEITMILAHEIGHHEANHVAEAFRRRTALAIATSGIGQIPVLGPIIVHLGNLGELSFSREAEYEADAIGLELLERHYGHVGGCTDFFERRLEAATESNSAEFLSTHPLSSKRIEKIRELARDEGWTFGETNAPPRECDGASGSLGTRIAD